MKQEDNALRGGLAALAAHAMPDATRIQIGAIARAGSGNSSENWFFEAAWHRPATGDERHDLVLRRSPANEIVRNSRIDEFRLLASLADTGISVPRVFWIDTEGDWLGRPSVVMERCAGRDDRALLTDRNKAGLDEATRLRLARGMVDLLAAIHRLDVDRLAVPPSIRRPSGHEAAIELDRQEREALADESVPCIEMRVAAWWLRDNLPPPAARRVLVHGDFRPANLLIDQGKATALLDWEFAHVGDPAEDLGWYLAARYRHDHFIADHWEAQDFIAAYEQASGVAVDRAAVRWWAIFGQYKLCAMVLAAQRAFLGGDAERIPVPAGAMFRGLLEDIAAEEAA